MGKITINKGQGGLSRVLPGEDHYTGIQFYGTAPSSWLADGNTYKAIASLKAAEDLGISKTGANTKVLWYHVSEFFRVQPNSILWVNISTAPEDEEDYTFNEVKALQSAADGRLRQIGVYAPIALATAQVNLLQNRAEELYNEFMPAVVVYASDISGVTSLSSLPDMRSLTAHYVAICIGQSGKGRGKELFDELDVSITCLGAMLGVISKSNVHENIGWVAQFDVSGGELDVPAFANGDAVKGKTNAELQAISDKGYCFIYKEVGINGTYFYDSPTAVAITNDYAYIESNRVIDKAVRGVRANILPQLKSPLYVDATTGKLAPDTIAYFETLAARPLEQMDKDGSVSGYGVFVDPDQNVNSSSKLVVNIRLIPVGVAREIEVNIGFALSI